MSYALVMYIPVLPVHNIPEAKKHIPKTGLSTNFADPLFHASDEGINDTLVRHVNLSSFRSLVLVECFHLLKERLKCNIRCGTTCNGTYERDISRHT